MFLMFSSILCLFPSSNEPGSPKKHKLYFFFDFALQKQILL